MKKIVGLFLSVIMITSTVIAYAKTIDVTENSVNIFVDGNTIYENNFIVDGTTYVPLRAISENMNADVVWDESVRQIHITRKLQTNNSTYLGHCIKMSEKLSTILNMLSSRSLELSNELILYSMYCDNAYFVSKLTAKINSDLNVLDSMANAMVYLEDEYYILTSIAETQETQTIGNSISTTESYILEYLDKLNEIQNIDINILASNSYTISQWCDDFAYKTFTEDSNITNVFNNSINTLLNP